jgi:hypothetical protein
VQTAALTVRFLLELTMLGVLAWWGWDAGGVLLALAAPLAAAVAWGLFVAPKRKYELGERARLAIELLLFASAVAALLALGQPLLAVGFAVVVAVDSALVRVL